MDHPRLVEAQRCIEAGMDAYLSKPIKADSLKELLDGIRTALASPAPDSTDAVHEQHKLLAPTQTEPLNSLSFDFDQAILEGDEEVIQIICPMFLNACDQQVDEIRTALRNADAELLHRSAHTFKGLVANFCAKPIEQLAKALEQKGKQNDFSDTEHLFAEMLVLIAPLKRALSNYLERNP